MKTGGKIINGAPVMMIIGTMRRVSSSAVSFCVRYFFLLLNHYYFTQPLLHIERTQALVQRSFAVGR